MNHVSPTTLMTLAIAGILLLGYTANYLISNFRLCKPERWINDEKQMNEYRSQFGMRKNETGLTWYVAGFGVCLVLTLLLCFHGKEILNILNGMG